MTSRDTNQPDLADRLVDPGRIFTLLVFYRWASLIPPVVSLLLADGDSDAGRYSWPALALAVTLNVLITLFPGRLNEALLERPWLLVADLLLVMGLSGLSGGWQTPYYLYVLSPLLAAAFFFQMRGALLAATFLSLSYLAAILARYVAEGDRPNWLVVVMALVGFTVIGAAFGFASSLVRRLRIARDDVAGAHRDLQVIHDLTISLQSAADVTEVEERVLEAVTRELGFPRAVVALVDQEAMVITAWMGRAREGALAGRLPHSAELPLSPESGAISACLLEGDSRQAANAPFTNDEAINAEIEIEQAHLFPLSLREHPVGILMVDAAGGSDQLAHLQSLEAIANQAAVTLGTTMMCIDRAQRLAVQEERVRIARDIHDTVSQSLFGIVYTLDGALKLLPDRPEAAAPELERVLTVAQKTRSEIRKSILDIWPSELTAEQFAVDLRKYADNICQAEGLAIDFSVHGDFARLSPRARRSLYRISQEALANVAHHARADNAQVCLDIGDQRAMLSIRDDGLGFDPDLAMQREYNRERFGLWGMRERALSLGGRCEIQSRPGAGTTVMVDVPVS